MIYRCRQCGTMPASLRRTGAAMFNRAIRRHGKASIMPRMLVTTCCGSSTFDQVINADTDSLTEMLQAKLESGELQEIT